MSLSLILILANACTHVPPPDPADAIGVLPCTTLAAGDTCMFDACSECVDFCGQDCATVDTEPLSFTCPGVGSFTIEQACPVEDVADPPTDG